MFLNELSKQILILIGNHELYSEEEGIREIYP